jgi:hypothetical protein
MARMMLARQALDVPLPGRRKRLVEIVDVENELALGRSKAAEIGDVAIAASLHADARGGSAGEIGGHHCRGAAEEREGRGAHPGVANRQQLRQSPAIRFF